MADRWAHGGGGGSDLRWDNVQRTWILAEPTLAQHSKRWPGIVKRVAEFQVSLVVDSGVMVVWR